MTGRRRRRAWQGAGVLTVALFFVLCAHDEVSMSGNEASRFAVLEAWGEQRTFTIEKTQFRTVDEVSRNGHVYSDKPLPLAFALGSLYGAVHRVGGVDFARHYHWIIYAVNVLFGGTVAVLTFLWLFNALLRRRPDLVAAAAVLALGAVLTGWLFAFGVSLNNHPAAALCALGCVIAVEKFRRRPTACAAALAGLAAGVLGYLDLPSGAIFGVAVLAALAASAPPGGRFRPLAAAVAAGALTLVLHALLNFAAYGDWKPLYVAAGGTYSPGLNKVWWRYAWDVLAGSRGLFSYQPFLLLAAGTLLTRRLAAGEKALLGGVLGVIVFYVAATDEYGGAAYGFRYLAVTIPVLWLYAGEFVLRRGRGRRSRAALAAALLIWGALTGIAGAYAPFCVAYEGYRSGERHFTRVIDNTFMGNVFCMAFERDPDGKPVRWFVRRYGRQNAVPYLFYGFLHQKKLEQLPEIRRRFAPGT